jgi:hypothetical protein
MFQIFYNKICHFYIQKNNKTCFKNKFGAFLRNTARLSFKATFSEMITANYLFGNDQILTQELLAICELLACTPEDQDFPFSMKPTRRAQSIH